MGCENWKLCAIILILISLIAFVRSQDQNPFVCMRNGNYATNSTYRANLNTLLSSVSSNISDNGFYNTSVGQNQDRVNALVLCRADQTLDQCRSCVQIASDALPQQCPNRKQAIIWYEFCMLRYSNEPIYGTQTNDPGSILRNSFNVPSPNEFRALRTRLLDDVRAQAARGGSALKVSAGNRVASDSRTLYGLMECTPDLSSDECDNCLVRAAQTMRSCCDSAAGVRILLPSCNLRYELYPFYNDARLRELHVLLPPVPSPPGTNDDTGARKEDDNRILKFVIIAVAAIYMITRMKRRATDTPECNAK